MSDYKVDFEEDLVAVGEESGFLEEEDEVDDGEVMGEEESFDDDDDDDDDNNNDNDDDDLKMTMTSKTASWILTKKLKMKNIWKKAVILI